MKKLTVIASLLLLPTFIVGLYGQNFQHDFPSSAGALATGTPGA
jgi:Mg2+ and Co2+ transporter CorA